MCHVMIHKKSGDVDRYQSFSLYGQLQKALHLSASVVSMQYAVKPETLIKLLAFAYLTMRHRIYILYLSS